jgi:hypothetical protein
MLEVAFHLVNRPSILSLLEAYIVSLQVTCEGKQKLHYYLNIPEKVDINMLKHGLERGCLDVAAQDDINANYDWHWYAESDSAPMDELAGESALMISRSRICAVNDSYDRVYYAEFSG